MSDGTSYSDIYDDAYGFAVGLAAAVGSAGHPTPGPGLATAVGSALNPAIKAALPLPQSLGATMRPATIDGALVTPDYGGSLTLPYYGGGVVPITFDGLLATGVTSGYGTGAYGGGSFGIAPVNSYNAQVTSLSGGYSGTLALTNYGAGLVGWTMQNVGLTLAENNDESVSVAITQSGSPLNLTGATVNMYLKTAQGTPDGSALLLSSAGGSPAITITNATAGLCTVAIPRADLYPETYTFYRIDVVFSGLQNTCAYGSITWITL